MSATTKAIEVIEDSTGQSVEIHVTGKLEKKDYDAFVPRIEQLIETHGKLRMLVLLEEFQGWTVGALWEDIKFDVKHFNDIERLALVGDSRWEAGMEVFCRPFTTAEIKYFHKDRLVDARRWIREKRDWSVIPTNRQPVCHTSTKMIADLIYPQSDFEIRRFFDGWLLGDAPGKPTPQPA